MSASETMFLFEASFEFMYVDGIYNVGLIGNLE